ncbi:MAG: Ig-like domain-containing protein [Methanobacteriota archaeon]
MLSSAALAATTTPQQNDTSEPKIVSKFSKQIQLSPGTDYIIQFTAQNLTLNAQHTEPYSKGLSEKTIAAIAKSPTWIQHALTQQFLTINNTEPYADLLLNVSTQYADEIAYSIAYSPLGNVPPADVIKANAFSLYENDEWIHYADIIDYDDGSGNYYSTIRYRVLENGIEHQYEYPQNIYYEYVVSMKTGGENPDFVYDSFWRDYLFNHNDLGYPLLKEKLSTIQYLWDGESYSEPAYRLWTPSIQEHPTAVEAVSYWISKTMNTPALGDRPNQPNIMAHEHNGYCGELQRLAVAAQRTALIPSIGICNIGEDHVWREFYERGWHQNDNWWSDTGGVVDQPDVYAYGWKKNMSAVFTWQPDDSITDTTARYIHPEDRITVSFTVKDGFLQPVDGARVVVLVKGLKDITSVTHTIWNKIQVVYEKLPLGGRLLQPLYDVLKKRYDHIPEVINGPTITTWNYTDMNGVCTFQLGKNIDYTFLIQEGNLKKPWLPARHNTIRFLRDHTDTTFHVVFSDWSHRNVRYQENKVSFGGISLDLSLNTTAFQLQQSVKTDNIGRVQTPGLVECFLVDEINYQNYIAGNRFICYNYNKKENGNFHWLVENKNWYLILRNPSRQTQINADVSIQVRASTTQDHVQIVTPETSVFIEPCYPIGSIITISGVATDTVTLILNNETFQLSPVDNIWSYTWNTSDLSPGYYNLSATCGGAQDEQVIRLLNLIPLAVTINTPFSGEIIEAPMLLIQGHSSSPVGVQRVDVAVDNRSYQTANGTTTWSIHWDVTTLSLGEHEISVRAVDRFGHDSLHHQFFIVNETGHDWKPQINNLTYNPMNPINISNMIVYANVTSINPFTINTVLLFWTNGTTTHSSEMYRYGDNPVQPRHEEDILSNQSNTPLFGYELGQFPLDETIHYWIVAYDTANNLRVSETQSFTIQT